MKKFYLRIINTIKILTTKKYVFQINEYLEFI